MASPYSDPYEEWKVQGRPGGSFQAWQASQGGGAAPQVTGGGVAAPAATPSAFNQAWMDEGLAAYNAGQRGSDPLRTPGFDPNTFRQNYAALSGGNRPEDLARFSDEGLAGWMPFYDPQTGKYRSMRGAEGWFDKPTECPPGMGPGGPDETDPCVPYGGQQAAPQPAQQAAPTATPQTAAGNPFAGLLAPQKGVPVVGGFGGVRTDQAVTNRGGSTPLQYGGINPGANTSSLASVLTPLQGQKAPDPLTSVMAPLMGQQKRKSPLAGTLTNNQSGRWF